jgi:hypothetical protein
MFVRILLYTLNALKRVGVCMHMHIHPCDALVQKENHTYIHIHTSHSSLGSVSVPVVCRYILNDVSFPRGLSMESAMLILSNTCCVCVYMYVCMYVYMFFPRGLSTESAMLILSNTCCVCVYMYVCMYVCLYVFPERPEHGVRNVDLEQQLLCVWYMYVCIFICMYMYTHVHAPMYVFKYAFMCIYNTYIT